MHLVLQDQLFCLRDAGIGFALVVLDNERHVHSAELIVMLRQIELEAVDHVFANLCKNAGHRRDIADAQLLRVSLGGQTETQGKTTAHQYFLQFGCHRHSSVVVMTFPLQIRKAS